MRQILLLITLALSGCSIGPSGSDEAVKQDQQMASSGYAGESSDVPAAVSIAGLEQPGSTTQNYVEILWEIPAQPVDEYLLRYGYTRDRLDHESKLEAEDVEKFNDTHHGVVYRHVLEGIDPQKTVYMTLQSVRDGQTSAPTEIFEVLGAGA